MGSLRFGMKLLSTRALSLLLPLCGAFYLCLLCLPLPPVASFSAVSPAVARLSHWALPLSGCLWGGGFILGTGRGMWDRKEERLAVPTPLTVSLLLLALARGWQPWQLEQRSQEQSGQACDRRCPCGVWEVSLHLGPCCRVSLYGSAPETFAGGLSQGLGAWEHLWRCWEA